MRTRSASPLRIGIVCGLLSAGAATADAQMVRLRGLVTDTAGAPLAGTDVRVLGHPYLTRTDDSGRFVFRFLPEGPVVLSFRRLGFVPLEIGLGAAAPDSGIHFVMAEVPSRLPVMRASAERTRQRVGIQGFHERRTQGIGNFVTREDIIARPSASHPTDILRTTPGVRVVRAEGGTGIRFIAAAVRRDCMPMIWVDGQRAPGLEIDQIALNSIEGIELYSGPSTTPMQFSYSPTGTTCGTIVVWTRNPGG